LLPRSPSVILLLWIDVTLLRGTNMSLKLYLSIVAAGGILFAGSMVDRSMNYTKVDARITSAKTDCYISARKSKLTDKTTGNIAYMDCGIAPNLAKAYDYSESDVKKRIILKIEYTSPADKSRKQVEHEISSATENYTRGQVIKIYAHSTEPAKWRWL
jgi:hypothetical protein